MMLFEQYRKSIRPCPSLGPVWGQGISLSKLKATTKKFPDVALTVMVTVMVTVTISRFVYFCHFHGYSHKKTILAPR
jgi:hypothetical protein